MATEAVLRIQHPNEYSSEQVIISSDRLVFTALKSDLILASKNTLALSANHEIHINSNGNLYLNVNEGSQIIIGKPGTEIRSSKQPAVMGTNLKNFVDDVMQLLITFQVTTPSGEGQSSPKVNEQVQKLKTKYLKKNSKNYILSDLLFIADNHK